MPNQSFAQKMSGASWLRLFPRVAGALTVLIGIIVITCWYAHWTLALQVLPNLPLMQFNTALCFILSGGGLFLLTTSRAKIAPWLGGLVGVFVLLTLVEYITGGNFGIDQLFFTPYLQIDTTFPGRMSPLAASCFLFIGMGLTLTAFSQRLPMRLAGVGLLACMAVSIALVALFGFITGIEAAYGWGAYSRMALPTAVAFVVLGSGLFVWSWRQSQEEQFNFLRWVPITASVTLMVMIGVVSAVSLMQLKDAMAWSDHTYEVLNSTTSLIGDLADTQRGMHSYVLATSPEALELYRGATNNAPPHLARLAELTHDNPVQQRRIKVLEADLDAVVAYSRQLIDIRDHRGLSAAVLLEKTSRGLAVINQIRSDLNIFRQEEQRLLAQREAAEAANFSNAARLLVLGSVLAAGLLVLANFMANLEVKRRRLSEDALRVSEERFRLTVQGVKDYAILMLDTEGRVSSWNSGAEHIKGYKAEEIIGQHFSRFYPPEAVASGKPERELAEALATGQVEDEGWRVRKDGSRFFADGIITTVRDASGKHRGFAKVTRDITERKAAQEKSAWLATFPELNPNPIVEIDPVSDMIYYINPTMTRLAPDLINLGAQHPLLAGLQEVKTRLMNREIDSVQCEVEMDEFFFAQIITYVPQAKRIRINFFDITERKKLINELQTALAEIKTLSGMIPICGWCKNIRNDTGYWSSVEEYVRSHTGATFSHGMCPSCSVKFEADIMKANGKVSA